jgi:hypothetical protein
MTNPAIRPGAVSRLADSEVQGPGSGAGPRGVEE